MDTPATPSPQIPPLTPHQRAIQRWENEGGEILPLPKPIQRTKRGQTLAPKQNDSDLGLPGLVERLQ